MKKVVPTLILFLITLSFAVYAFIKADEAEKSAIEAVAAQQEAMRMREEVNRLQSIAEQAAAEARAAQAAALEAVKECEASKK